MSFTATLAGSGETFPLDPSRSILDSALAAGRRFPFGCRGGTCGACKALVVAGEVDHGPLSERPALSPAEQAEGYALMCRAKPLSDLTLKVTELGGIGAVEVRTLPVRVVALEKLAPDVMELHLALPKTEHLGALPGQYIEFLMKDGKARAFSLANAPREAGEPLQLHIRHYPGGVFSGFVFNELKVGALLRIRGPLGAFTYRDTSARPMVFVAGGTGFAPIKGIIEHVLSRFVDRPMHLYWGARAQSDLYMHRLAEAWAPRVQYTPVLYEADAGWSGRTGMVHEAVAADIPDASLIDVYSSGPPPMVRAVREALIAKGLDPEHFYSDAFESAKP
jgi:CDP-4-dehydro-6-deoxyglucose reductase, E3